VRYVVWGVIALAAIAVLHVMLLAMERRGWIFYKNVKPTKGAAGAGLLAVHQLFEPGKRTYIEREQYDERAAPEAGAPPLLPVHDAAVARLGKRIDTEGDQSD